MAECNFTDSGICNALENLREALVGNGAASAEQLGRIADEFARLNDNLESWHPEFQRQITGMNTALHGIWNCCVTGRKLSELLLKVSMQNWQKMPDAKWNIYCGLKQDESDAGDEVVMADGTVDFSVSTGPGDTQIGPESLPPEFTAGKPGADGGPQVGPGTSGGGTGTGDGGGSGSGGSGDSGGGSGTGDGGGSGSGGSGDSGGGSGTGGGGDSGAGTPGTDEGAGDPDPDAPNNDPDTGGWCYPESGTEDRS